MKKVIKILSLMTAPVILAAALCTGCHGKSVDSTMAAADIMADIDLFPTQTAVYEEYTKLALEEYKAVAARHTDASGDVDLENAEVVAAANEAAAKMFAYACYNERYLDHYVYFSNKDGETDLGSVNGSADATTQDYFLRINEQFDGNGELITCGYRYHSTIKKVTKSSGTIKTFKSKFESAKVRYTVDSNIIYRFKADTDTIRFTDVHPTMDVQMLECDWETDTSDWGVPEPDVTGEMRKGAYIEPEDIEADVIAHAGEENISMRCNINILADNIVDNAMIYEEDEGGIFVVMTIDTTVANSDNASLKMLRAANGSSNCKWQGSKDDSGLIIIYRLWSNGLFRMYATSERWSGKISIFSGTADTTMMTFYSYSDRDCDMSEYLKMLEDGIAKENK